jgi:hypothetical protein
VRSAAALATAVFLMGACGQSPTVPTRTPATEAPSVEEQPGGDPRLGIGEPLIVIVAAGPFATRQEAEVAARERSLGDIQGFYVDEAGHYEQLARYDIENQSLRWIGDPGPFVRFPVDGWIVLTAFRTRAGAESFMNAVNAAELEVQAWQVAKTGGEYIGLGQEAHPDGSGPLEGPLPNQQDFQR